jgi:hypothetical protein
MTMTLVARPATDEYAPYYERYVGLVPPDGDVVAALREQIGATMRMLRPITSAQAASRYAPDKWSVKQVVGHLADAERVFAYRALRFARGDETPLASFDENAWAATARTNDRAFGVLLDEFQAVRTATIALFSSFTADEMARWGTASGYRFTVRALAYIIAGHELHHRRVLTERYGLLAP